MFSWCNECFTYFICVLTFRVCVSWKRETGIKMTPFSLQAAEREPMPTFTRMALFAGRICVLSTNLVGRGFIFLSGAIYEYTKECGF
jgi:hypothetical protein